MAGIGTGAFPPAGEGTGVATADVVDTGNATTTPLSGNASFTGTAISTLGFVAVEVLIYSDHDSASQGVQIQFSSDNTNWDDASTYSYTSGNAAPNAGQVYIAPIRAKWCRVKYINGSSAQGTFRLNTIFKTGHPTAETIPMSDVPTLLGSHGILTKSAIVGKTTAGGGSFVDVKVNPSGALTTAVTAADGDVFVRSNAASTFPVNASQVTSPWVVQQSATLAVTLQTVAIAASSSGDNTLLSAQGTGKKIYVYAFELSFSGTVNAKFTDGASGTNVGGLYYGVANAGAADSVDPPNFLWVGTANTALVINLSAGTAVGGAIRYFVI